MEAHAAGDDEDQQPQSLVQEKEDGPCSADRKAKNAKVRLRRVRAVPLMPAYTIPGLIGQPKLR